MLTAYSDPKCDNCPHVLSGHNEGHDCECSKFVYPTPALAALRFLADVKPGASRDSLDDALNDIFGRRYSREMKGLMRGAFREGLQLAGVVDPTGYVDEKAIDKMWSTQKTYTNHIKNDLRAAIESGSVKSTETLQTWFAANDYRSQMTGRFMAWQGVNAGIARAAKERGRRLRWVLGIAEHCDSCDSRAGQTYTYDELTGIGFPGSAYLLCKSSCKCHLEEQK